MSRTTHARKRPMLWSIVLVLLAASAAALVKCTAEPTPQTLRLADGTQAWFLSDTHILPADDYPRTRQIRVDGDVFIRAAPDSRPLIVSSRLLVLTVTGASAFRMTAYAREAGEQVEVLYGHVQANKAYESPYNEPDLLTGGEMTMINKSIDLMEKEKTDIAPLRAWSDALIASVAAAQNKRSASSGGAWRSADD